MNKKIKQRIAYLLTVTLLASVTASSSFRLVKAEELKGNKQEIAKLNQLLQLNGNNGDHANVLSMDKNDEAIVNVIVQLQDKPLLENFSSSKDKSVKEFISENKNELTNIQSNQEKIMNKASNLKGANMGQQYMYTINGFSMDIKRGEIKKLQNLPGVKKVTESKYYSKDMSYAKKLGQVYESWEKFGYKGEGMVVAVIDSGQDASHKDMRISDGTKARLDENSSKNLKIPGKYISKKIPYGYNYADKNTEVKDADTTMHGMHVAGMIAANCSEAEEGPNAVKGVAPEAQVLSMKVFSNVKERMNQGSEADIVKAIDDSVALGADVINMSLGSPAGFQDENDPEQASIKKAVDAGTVVVVSAGNSGISTYDAATSSWVKPAGLYDTSIVGSPGLGHDTIQVASYENTNITGMTLRYTSSKGDGKNGFLYSVSEKDPAIEFKDKGMIEVVNCNQGASAADFPADKLKGKIALVQKVSGTYSEKKTLAQTAGAAGVIFYNAEGVEEIVHTTQIATIKIPCICVSYSSGKALLDLATSNLKVGFDGKLTAVENGEKDAMSSFTSWGPTPNLDFKPNISGIGGNVWSTANDNGYQSMSGTSMASPFVAGCEAVLVQAIKANNPGLKGRALVELAKQSSINTSRVVMDVKHPNVPYSPRRQGAGLVQLKDAINNKVVITDQDNNATVALKEIGKTKTFTLKLKNYGKTDATYKVEALKGVLKEVETTLTDNPKTSKKEPYDLLIDGAKINFSQNNVTVKANSETTVDVTLTLPDNFATEQFVEGFIRFTSADEKVPSLGVPYMGFYGKWDKMVNIDKPLWDKDSLLKVTGMFAPKVGDKTGLLSLMGSDLFGNVTPSKIAFSPNGDDVVDWIVPRFKQLRNAKQITAQIVNDKNQVVATIYDGDKLPKNKDLTSNYLFQEFAWDGTDAKGKTVPDGNYTYRFITTLDYKNAAPQNLDMQVKVDTVKPTLEGIVISKVDKGKYNVKWTSKDAGSGVDVKGIFVDDNIQPGKIIQNGDDFSLDVSLTEGKHDIEILVADAARNIITVTKTFYATNFDIASINIADNQLVNSKDLTVAGKITQKVQDLKVNGTSVTINDDLSFSTSLKLAEGNNTINITALAGGTNVFEKNYMVICDTTSPAISIDGVVDGKLYNTAVKPVITSDDASATISSKLNGKAYNGEEIKADGDYELVVNVADKAGNKSTKTVKFSIDQTAPKITVTGVENGKTYDGTVKAVISVDDANATVTKELNGKAYNSEDITLNGDYALTVKAIDKAGNAAEVVCNFKIARPAPVVDNGKPDTKPTPAAIDGSVSFKFTGKLLKGDAFDSIKLVDKDSKTVAATFEIKDNLLMAKPNNKLDYAGSYTVVIPENALKDEYGNKVLATKCEFTTVNMPWTDLTPGTPCTPWTNLTPATAVAPTNNTTTTTPAKLTKTGSSVDFGGLMVIGSLLSLAGIVLFRKNK